MFGMSLWRGNMIGHLSPSVKNLVVIVLLGELVFVQGLGEVVFLDHNVRKGIFT